MATENSKASSQVPTQTDGGSAVVTPPKPKKHKPPSRRESQRARDKKERDNICEVEETIKRISSHQGIVGTVICDGDGIPLRSTLDKETTLQYAAFITPLAARARMITKSHNPKDDLTLLRIRTRTNEIIVTTERNFYLIIAQKTGLYELPFL